MSLGEKEAAKEVASSAALVKSAGGAERCSSQNSALQDSKKTNAMTPMRFI
jgi:hypothetical protein